MRRIGERRARSIVLAVIVIGASALFAPRSEALAAKGTANGTYLYTLSNFTGPIPYNWSRVAVDRERNEVYVLYQNLVRVFNDSGMEVYRFGDDLGLQQILDVTIDDRGDILLLAYQDSKSMIVRCDYRGRPRSVIALEGLPEQFSPFVPNRFVFQRGELWLVSTMSLAVVRSDRDGRVTKTYDLFRLLDLEERDRGNIELGGFSVDKDGNVLLTVPVLARAFVLSADGNLRGFGKPGGAPGRFNIPGGIARDSKGNFVVVDKLKGAVLVFDPRFEFVAQFASYGHKAGQLTFPDDLAIDGRDRVFVTQMSKRGVSVFQLTYQ